MDFFAQNLVTIDGTYEKITILKKLDGQLFINVQLVNVFHQLNAMKLQILDQKRGSHVQVHFSYNKYCKPSLYRRHAIHA